MPLWKGRKQPETPQAAGTPAIDPRTELLRNAKEYGNIHSEFDVERALALVPQLRVEGLTTEATGLARSAYDYYVAHNNTDGAGRIAAMYKLGDDLVVATEKAEYQGQMRRGEFAAAIKTAERASLGPEMRTAAALALHSSQMAKGQEEDALSVAAKYLDPATENATAVKLYQKWLADADRLQTSHPLLAAESLERAARLARTRTWTDKMATPAERAYNLLVKTALEKNVPYKHAPGVDIFLDQWFPTQAEAGASPFFYGYWAKEDKETGEQLISSITDGRYDAIYTVGFKKSLAALERALGLATGVGLGEEKVASAAASIKAVARELFNHQFGLVNYHMNHKVTVMGFVDSMQRQGVNFHEATDLGYRRGGALPFELPSLSVYAAKSFADGMVETAKKYGLGGECVYWAQLVAETVRNGLDLEKSKFGAAASDLDMKIAIARGTFRERNRESGLVTIRVNWKKVMSEYDKRVENRSTFVYEKR